MIISILKKGGSKKQSKEKQKKTRQKKEKTGFMHRRNAVPDPPVSPTRKAPPVKMKDEDYPLVTTPPKRVTRKRTEPSPEAVIAIMDKKKGK